ncbi:hypothetical protein FRC17_010618 [Serendipita sp. 399]|nr:hypothetical protein FRC17_010618 [Serendipita sp. 399]
MKTPPDDILLDIFDVYTSIHGLDQSPVKLLRISKHVRELVRAASHLWSSVRIYLHSESERQSVVLPTGLEAYLGLSERVADKLALLDITISCPAFVPMTGGRRGRSWMKMEYPVETCLQEVVNILRSPTMAGGPRRRLERWRSLAIFSDAPEHTVGPCDFICLTVPYLPYIPVNESVLLNLEVLECRNVSIIIELTAPKLRRLILNTSMGISGLNMPHLQELILGGDNLVLQSSCRRVPSLTTLEVFQSRFKELKITAKDPYVFQPRLPDQLDQVTHEDSDLNNNNYYLAQELLRIVDSRGGTLQVLEDKYIEDGASVREAASRKTRRFL